jgi:hypothetical protein
VRARPPIQRLPLVVRLRSDDDVDDDLTASATPATSTSASVDAMLGTDTPLTSSVAASDVGASTTTNTSASRADDDNDGPDTVSSGTLKFRRNALDDALLYDERIVPMSLDTLVQVRVRGGRCVMLNTL